MSAGQFVLKIVFPFLIADQAEKIVHGIAYSFSTLGRPRRHTMDMYGDDARYSQASSTPSPGLRKRLSTNLEVGPVSSSKYLLVSKADCQKMMMQQGRIGFTITLIFAKTNKQNRWLVPVQNAFTSTAAWDTHALSKLCKIVHYRYLQHSTIKRVKFDQHQFLGWLLRNCIANNLNNSKIDISSSPEKCDVPNRRMLVTVSLRSSLSVTGHSRRKPGRCEYRRHSADDIAAVQQSTNSPARQWWTSLKLEHKPWRRRRAKRPEASRCQQSTINGYAGWYSRKAGFFHEIFCRYWYFCRIASTWLVKRLSKINEHTVVFHCSKDFNVFHEWIWIPSPHSWPGKWRKKATQVFKTKKNKKEACNKRRPPGTFKPFHKRERRLQGSEVSLARTIHLYKACACSYSFKAQRPLR